ncbi:hypothetical protein BMF94_6404 [Rhodotorula taiwanensis]|uniref:Cytochrome b5 heme-binding domain-containing protein n=1 Tax=Rhodotorula taiwanensis TaxID=741276 RepID=A0A2S5B1J5_9BASI|nr:hypothetical protein BMF94_6404 [Rhodotorula taiwanensis]
MFQGLTGGLSRVLGYTTAPDSSHTIPSIVAEPETKSIAFPAVGSQQRAGTAAPTPSLSLSLPGADSDDDGEALEDQEEDDDDFVSPGAPRLRVNGSGATASKRNSRPLAPSDGQSGGLLPPPSTVKVVKAPKGRVRVEKGFSQLDWAKLNRTGEVDLTGGIPEPIRVTPSELAKHNTREDCWQVYAGRVYNVGPFLRYHPGGVGEMMRGAGKDATQLFMLAHAWVNYETLLENCLVGFLVPEPSS